jgi:hypothetical protein
VHAGDGLLTFSLWSELRAAGHGIFETVDGTDLFAYDLQDGEWRTVPGSAGAVPVPLQTVATSGGVIVRGAPYNCVFCEMQPPAAVSGLYDPVRNSWTRLPPDPLAGAGPESAWTGVALFSFDPSLSPFTGQATPGQGAGASVYDPSTKRWTLLPAAPLNCPSLPIPYEVLYSYPPVIWTGQQILVYCPQFGDPPTAPAGLAYTPGHG